MSEGLARHRATPEDAGATQAGDGSSSIHPTRAADASPGTGALGPPAARLAAQLAPWPRRTLRLDEVWRAWSQANPTLRGRPDERRDLAAALGELQSAGLLRCSATLDRGVLPRLPTRITLTAGRAVAGPSATQVARSVAWRPELAWVVSASLSHAQVEQLRDVNAWLRDHGHENDRISARERSLQVLGHEKALDRLMSSGAAGPGRLTLDMLRTYRVHPPLPSTRIGSGPVLLVVENADTFATVEAVMRDAAGDSTATGMPVGHVAWGAGGAFEASVRSTGELPGVERVRYFGDIDADGLRIPLNAALTASAEGLPPVLPATSLYRHLLATGVRQDGQTALSAEHSARLAAWVSATDVADGISALLQAGVRVPQEALNRAILAAQSGWFCDL